MIEKIIYLEDLEPLEVYGVNNIKFERLSNAFPKLKIIARGNEIKVLGEEEEIESFEKVITQIRYHINTFNTLSKDDLNKIIEGKAKEAATKASKAEDVLIYGNSGKAISARTPHQQELVEKYQQKDLIFAIGPAGTGKTYTAIALAVRAFRNKEIKRIILSRPAVEAGESLGFLPGDMKEKLDPYLQALYDALFDMIPFKKLNEYMEEGTIQIAPLAYMRGRTLDNACVILDEAQNVTSKQLKMFLTRMGNNAKFLVTGDLTQIDLPGNQTSGLIEAQKILKGVSGISSIYFDDSDIIRHPLVKKIVDAYDAADQKKHVEQNKKKSNNKNQQKSSQS